MNRAIAYAAAPFAYAAGICFAAATVLFAGSVYLMQPVIARLRHRDTRSSDVPTKMHKSQEYSCHQASSSAPLRDECGHQTREPFVSLYSSHQSVALGTDREECSRLLRRVEERIF